eukprot:CAMPEP_0185853808 /NCGR_PEP_ID=MMETSP1354-20130828/20298_1 /TAXON_ID=708628 /ORGANISM="Erythrolobus madagascarensis, Strain CCMP3276" /LENGTH=48 /DNA_ID= /DNA_START= /DNA_END= /DNA_ORIENTATION=
MRDPHNPQNRCRRWNSVKLRACDAIAASSSDKLCPTLAADDLRSAQRA